MNENSEARRLRCLRGVASFTLRAGVHHRLIFFADAAPTFKARTTEAASKANESRPERRGGEEVCDYLFVRVTDDACVFSLLFFSPPFFRLWSTAEPQGVRCQRRKLLTSSTSSTRMANGGAIEGKGGPLCKRRARLSVLQ